MIWELPEIPETPDIPDIPEDARENSKFFWFSSHLFVPLTFGRRYFRSEMQKKNQFFFCISLT